MATTNLIVHHANDVVSRIIAPVDWAKAECASVGCMQGATHILLVPSMVRDGRILALGIRGLCAGHAEVQPHAPRLLDKVL